MFNLFLFYRVAGQTKEQIPSVESFSRIFDNNLSVPSTNMFLHLATMVSTSKSLHPMSKALVTVSCKYACKYEKCEENQMFLR